MEKPTNNQPPKNEKPIIKRIKSLTKKQKIIRLVIIVVVIALLVGIGFLVKKSVDKSNQNKLKSAKQATADIRNQISDIENKKKTMDKAGRLKAENDKIKLYQDQIAKYRQAKKLDDELELSITFMAYLINTNQAEYGIPFIQDFDIKRLSTTQKISFYQMASRVFHHANYKKKSEEYTKKYQELQKQLNQQLQKPEQKDNQE